MTATWHAHHSIDHDSTEDRSVWLSDVALQGRDANGTLHRFTCDLATFQEHLHFPLDENAPPTVDHVCVALLSPVSLSVEQENR